MKVLFKMSGIKIALRKSKLSFKGVSVIMKKVIFCLILIICSILSASAYENSAMTIIDGGNAADEYFGNFFMFKFPHCSITYCCPESEHYCWGYFKSKHECYNECNKKCVISDISCE